MSETSSNAIPAYLPLRNDLIGEEPYGAPQLDVPVCLNVNENPYAPEPAVVETIAQRVKEIAPTLNRYPDREHIELRKAFSTYLERESGVKLSVDQLWGANGSNEIMLQLFQAFGGPGRIALGCDPTYSMYPEYARDTFTTWKLAHRNADFTLDVDATIKAIEDVKPAMIVLTSPNNPTGTPLKMDDLKRVLGAAETAEVAGKQAQQGSASVAEVAENITRVLRHTEELKESMTRLGLRVRDIDKVLKTTLINKDGKYVINRKYVGHDAAVILRDSGVSFTGNPRLIIAETDRNHPFVMTEMLMPVLPIVRVSNIDEAVEEAFRAEQGCKHSAMIHSTNVHNMSKAARKLNTTIFVKNSSSFSGLGFDGEGYTTMTARE